MKMIKNISTIMISVGIIILVIATIYLIKSNNEINYRLICVYDMTLIIFGIFTLLAEFYNTFRLKKIEEELAIINQISEIDDEKNKVELLKAIIE